MLKKLDVDLEAYENKQKSLDNSFMTLFQNLNTLKNLKVLKVNFDSSDLSN